MISIIIPAYNEEESLPHLIRFLKSCNNSEYTEIIISDGGSSDGTVAVAESLGVKVFSSPKKGRASQMNFGATKASGNILYFLHADTFPPKTFISDIRRSLNSEIEAGCFRLTFDYQHFLLKAYSWFTKFDIDFFRFGDQSLFITKTLFNKIGGFDEHLIVMEDQKIIWPIKRETKFIIHSNSVVTSARKYIDIGVIRLQVIFSTIFLMYYLGFSQEQMVKFYKNRIG